MTKMHRHDLSKRDVKELLERALRLHPLLHDKLRALVKERWELVKIKNFVAYLVNGSPMLIEVDGNLIPSIKLAEEASYPKIVVDMGAVPHLSLIHI